MKEAINTHLQARLAPWLARSWLLSIIATYTLRYNYTFELRSSVYWSPACLISVKHWSHWWNHIIATFPNFLVSSYREIAEEVSINCMAYTDYVMLMANYTCTGLHHLLKLLPRALLLCTDSSQPQWFHVETYMRVLGLWFANTAAAIIAIKQVQC